ncbi:hypothetical protein SD77_3591 [Bacillus badius]|uniref:Uncharacterized protein n=1 Tax=Bacillus badius TaxID=1455 RepID=A0ABR5AXV1_BACBA|nr:hypothetical protein SD77_3591 [Bacillus badius]
MHRTHIVSIILEKIANLKSFPEKKSGFEDAHNKLRAGSVFFDKK